LFINRLNTLSYLITLIFVLTSCGGQNAVEFKLMSYNIKHGMGNDDTLDLSRSMEVIKEQRPDLLALQEIDHFAQRSDSIDQTQYFADALEMEGTFGAFMDFQGGAYGMATLASKPLLRTEIVALTDGLYEPRVSIVHEVEVADEISMLFANVHFDWISGDKGEQSRLAQAKALLSYLDQFDLPTVITGDFNCTPDSPTMNVFYDAGFVFAHKGHDNLSFQGEKKVEIDHVIFRNTDLARFSVNYIDLLDEPMVSDHRPLVAVIELIY
jgi:endonuclease/exonuclease/phosphatase family metal-dependent hydrolase